MLDNDTGSMDKAAGVQIALEKICALEARLRGAIQTMQPLSTSLSVDPKAADREREGLFAVREALELMEDKLREYSASTDPRDIDALEDEAVLLSQLDSLRKELITECRENMPFIIFGKDVIKEILQFSEIAAPEEVHVLEGTNPEEADEWSPLKPLSLNDESPHLGRRRRPPWLADPAPTGTLKKGFRLDKTDSWTKENDDAFDDVFQTNSPMVSPQLASGLGLPVTTNRLFRDLLEPESPVHTRAGMSLHRPTTPSLSEGPYATTSGASSTSRNPPLSPSRTRDKELYKATNGSSRYPFDPEYGGKVNLRQLQGKKNPISPRVPSEKPRIWEPQHEQKQAATDGSSDDESSMSAATWVEPPVAQAAASTTEQSSKPAVRDIAVQSARKEQLVLRVVKAAAACVVLLALGGGLVAFSGKGSVKSARKEEEPSRGVVLGGLFGSSTPPPYLLRDNYYSAAPPTSKMFPLHPPPSFSVSRG